MTDTDDPMMSEASVAEALRPFGWTCTEEFWQRYHSDPWVFNLANAVERQAAELRGAREREAAWKKAAMLYQRLAADGVLRLKQGYSYAQAQDRYNEAMAAEPGSPTTREDPE